MCLILGLALVGPGLPAQCVHLNGCNPGRRRPCQHGPFLGIIKQTDHFGRPVIWCSSRCLLQHASASNGGGRDVEAQVSLSSPVRQAGSFLGVNKRYPWPRRHVCLAIAIELHHSLAGLGSWFLSFSNLFELHYETRQGRNKLPTTAATFS